VPSQAQQPEPAENRGLKRSPSIASDPDPDQKRQRTSPSPRQGEAGSSKDAPPPPPPPNAVAYWAKEGRWPNQFPDMALPLRHLIARKRPPPSDSTTSVTRDDGKLHPGDSIMVKKKTKINAAEQYRDNNFEGMLESKNVYMEPLGEVFCDIDKNMCSALLFAQQPHPLGSIFDDETFKTAFRNMRGRNEGRFAQDISRLIVPSAETLSLDHNRLGALIESVGEEWDSSIPLTETHPQPAYAVGFRDEAFEEDQFAKLEPFTGNQQNRDQSFFLGTHYMYFPFLAYEMKHGPCYAERKNAETMAVAIRGVVELFRAVDRLDEINQRILGFSVSHDRSFVQIHAYYPVIEGQHVKYYTHALHKFDITAMRGRERWTSFRFTKNVYETWAPLHLKRICSAIDLLPPHPDYRDSSLSAVSGALSLGPGHLLPSTSNSSVGLAHEEGDSQRDEDEGLGGSSHVDE